MIMVDIVDSDSHGKRCTQWLYYSTTAIAIATIGVPERACEGVRARRGLIGMDPRCFLFVWSELCVALRCA
ncbi:hypothetical protein B296_00046163 [Ensete ventricosum]|uniref:Uncharacterized protein n=1 Tax=Ensete ventricosum TaxID=4639 RepID=A0A426Z4W9_ENSVE|nr:hypothetical protein B296_00046163 [Ensete ventricosum]